MDAKELYTGSEFVVKALETRNGKCYFDDFYGTLEDPERKSILQLVKHFANRKQLRNNEKFRKLRVKIFELKPHPVRLLGFYCGEGFSL